MATYLGKDNSEVKPEVSWQDIDSEPAESLSLP